MPRRARTPRAYPSQVQVQGKASSDNEIVELFFITTSENEKFKLRFSL